MDKLCQALLIKSRLFVGFHISKENLIRARVVGNKKGVDSADYSAIAEKILQGMLDEVRVVPSK